MKWTLLCSDFGVCLAAFEEEAQVFGFSVLAYCLLRISFQPSKAQLMQNIFKKVWMPPSVLVSCCLKNLLCFHFLLWQVETNTPGLASLPGEGLCFILCYSALIVKSAGSNNVILFVLDKDQWWAFVFKRILILTWAGKPDLYRNAWRNMSILWLIHVLEFPHELRLWITKVEEFLLQMWMSTPCQWLVRGQMSGLNTSSEVVHTWLISLWCSQLV